MIRHVEFNSKDCKQIGFLIEEDDGSTQKVKAMIRQKQEEKKLEEKGHIIVSSEVITRIGDFGLMVTILYIPKGKYKYGQ